MQFPDDDEEFAQGTWEARVAYLPTGEAVTPGWLIVRNEFVADAVEVLAGAVGQEFVPVEDTTKQFGAGNYTLLRAAPEVDLVKALGALNEANIAAQPSHVLFADGNGVAANPVYANAAAVPVGLPSDCDPHPGGAAAAAGVIASPVYANPVYANPIDPQEYRTTGLRRSTARPAGNSPAWKPPEAELRDVVVAILDTGMAHKGYRPVLFQGDPGELIDSGDTPDEPVGSGDGVLDPAAGHGTFIAGLIRRLAPSATLKSRRVLSTFGDGKEPEIANHIDRLAAEDDPVDILNLSFGGYSPTEMAPVAEAIANLQEIKGTVVVASAGNDGTCRKTWPACVPEVVSVGALNAAGDPAAFSNFGDWVRAWAPGTDVVSAFFDTVPADGEVPAFDDWATWSGTSFAAPIVAAMIARRMIEAGIDAKDAWMALEAEGAPAFPGGGVRIDLPAEA